MTKHNIRVLRVFNNRHNQASTFPVARNERLPALGNHARPQRRTLLKVEIDRTDEADQIFTAPMGDLAKEKPRGSLHGVDGTSLWFNSVFMVQCTRTLDVQVAHAQRVVLDEIAAGLDQVAHQGGEDLVGFVDLVDLDLEQGAGIGVERGFPELGGVHFA